MIARLLMFSAIALAAAAPAAEPRQPTGQWIVNFDDAQCVAQRDYGTADKPLTLTGTITESGYSQPHGHVELKTADKTWHVVLAPPSRMESRGLPKEALASGGQVTVQGYPHRSKADELRAERITGEARNRGSYRIRKKNGLTRRRGEHGEKFSAPSASPRDTCCFSGPGIRFSAGAHNPVRA